MPSRMGRWVRRRAAVAITAVVAVVSFAACDRAFAADEWMRILQSGDAGIELLLRAPEPVADGGGWRVPEFDAGGEPGFPIVYERGTSIAVPGPRGARLTILDSNVRSLGRGTPPIHPQLQSQVERRAAGEAGSGLRNEGWVEAEAVPRDAIYPAAVVSLGGMARVRGRDVVTLQFQPLQYEPDGTARFTESVRVRLEFSDRPVPARSSVAAAAPDPLHDALLNAATASTWALPGAAPARPRTVAPAGGSSIPPERLRIRIGRRGFYQLTYGDLQAAGVPVASPTFEPRTFQLYFDQWKPVPLYTDSLPSSWNSETLQEAAIWVPGEADGFSSADSLDRVVFYALGPEGWEDLAGTSTDSLAWFRHPYDRDQYAWLVWGGEFGRRVAVADGAPVSGDSLLTRVWARTHLEEDHDFDAVDDMWFWEEVRNTRPLNRTISLDLGGESAVTGTLRIKVGHGAATANHAVDVRWNTIDLGRATFSQFGGQGRWFPFSNVTLQNSNQFGLTVPPGFATSTLFLEADAAWERPLVATARVLEWSRRVSATSESFELRNFGTAPPLVWDVTDPWAPVRVENPVANGSGAATTWRVHHGGAAGSRRHYYAAGFQTATPWPYAQRFSSRDLVRRNVAPLRSRTTSPDMVILTHSTLRTAAERLAQHRRTHWRAGGTPDIAVVDVNDVYENFSGGRLDPLAVRNYLKFLYGLEPAPHLLYALFFGDATYDPRRIRAASAATLVPTVQPGYYGQLRDGSALGFSAVDDWLGEMDTPVNRVPHPYPVPDLAHGRITARNAAEAERIVDKIIAYETTSGFGLWRCRIIMAADDECNPRNGCSESYHIGNSESLIRRIPPDLDVIKFYETEFPRVLGQKPSARAAFIRLWSEGCAVINFQGHGAARQLTDEVMMLAVDVPSLTNGPRAPLFLPISCTVSEFDGPDRQSMCEDLLASTAGGAIATIGATKPTFVGTNLIFNERLFEELFRDNGRAGLPVGVIEQRTKLRATNDANETYLVLGDPAMALVLPRNRVRFTAGVDSLLAGHRATVTGTVVASDSAATPLALNGQAEVEVFGTVDDSGYRSPEPPNIFLSYDLQGPPLYRGSVPVVNGNVSFQFIVPLGVRVGAEGRVSIYAYDDAIDAKGADPTVQILASEEPGEPSLGPPRIALRFPNDRTRVKAGTILTAEIRDENGIGIQGTTLRNSISIDFDGRNEPLNVTSQFRYAAGSDSVGTVDVPLPADLEPGAHSATVIAYDNLDNQSLETIEFELVEAEITQLVNVIAFPNPFRDWTRFFFEITDPADVEVVVFTTDGREVWREKQRIEAGAQASIRWDGVDRREDTLANGTYLYRLRAKPDRAGAPTLEKIGKVVIMR